MRFHSEMVRVEVGENRLRVTMSRLVSTKHIIIDFRLALIAFDVADILVGVTRSGHVGRLIGATIDAVIDKERILL